MGCASSVALVETEEYKAAFASTASVTVAEELVELNVGVKRNVVSWLPVGDAPVNGIVLVVHGLHEHSFRHHAVGIAMAERGYAVYGLDFGGHGRSDGVRGMIYNADDLVEDVVKFAAHVVAKHADLPLPISLYAHSMGTLISFFALHRIAGIKAAVFSACALIPGPDSGSPFGISALYPLTKSSSAVTLAKIMAGVAPEGDAAPIVLEGLMHDVQEQQIDKADPRVYHGSIRNKTAYELLKMTPRCLGENGIKSFPIDLRIAFFHGEDDKLTMPKSSQDAFDACPCTNKTIAFQANAKHEILHEAAAISGPILIAMCEVLSSSVSSGNPLDSQGVSLSVNLVATY